MLLVLYFRCGRISISDHYSDYHSSFHPITKSRHVIHAYSIGPRIAMSSRRILLKQEVTIETIIIHLKIHFGFMQQRILQKTFCFRFKNFDNIQNIFTIVTKSIAQKFVKRREVSLPCSFRSAAC